MALIARATQLAPPPPSRGAAARAAGPGRHVHGGRSRHRAGRHPALAGGADHRVVDGERGHPGVGRHRRQHRHPLVERVQPTRSGSRSTSAPPRPSARSCCNWETAYATAFQIQASADGADLDLDLLDDHRHRRHADAQRHRHRPVRPHVRDRARHRLRLLAVGVPGLRHGRHRRRQVLRHRRTRRSNQPATASSTENAGTPAAAAVDGNTGTRWSSAFTDPQWLAGRPRLRADDLPGRAELGDRVRDGVPDPGLDRRHRPGRRSTPRPPAPAASRP